MKRILIALVVTASIGMVSCSKETEVKPTVEKTQTLTGEKQDMGGWD